jgi:hypothetical protein
MRELTQAFGPGKFERDVAMRTKLAVLVAGVGLFALAVPVVAHHGFDTEYVQTPEAEVKLTGVVKEVTWTNPHMRMYIDVTDAKGVVTNWNLEITSPNTVRRQGWRRNDLVPGEKVEFTAYRGKVVPERGQLRTLTKLSDGRELFRGPANPQ